MKTTIETEGDDYIVVKKDDHEIGYVATTGYNEKERLFLAHALAFIDAFDPNSASHIEILKVMSGAQTMSLDRDDVFVVGDDKYDVRLYGTFGHADDFALKAKELFRSFGSDAVVADADAGEDVVGTFYVAAFYPEAASSCVVEKAEAFGALSKARERAVALLVSYKSALEFQQRELEAQEEADDDYYDEVLDDLDRIDREIAHMKSACPTEDQHEKSNLKTYQVLIFCDKKATIAWIERVFLKVHY